MAGEYRIPYSDGREQGTWKYAGPGIKAHVTCPDCGATISLHNHTIDETGVVDPSVFCGTIGCGFNRFIQLYQWRDIYPPEPTKTEKEVVEFYIKHDAPEGGDGSEGRPLRSADEVANMLGADEEAKVIFLGKPAGKKKTKKKTKKKAKRKAKKKAVKK